MAKVQLNLSQAQKITNWSPEQEAIFAWGVNKVPGHLLVRARAGTGKTSTLVEMVNRTKARSICVAAFNKTIATELQTRLTGTNVKAATLHSLGFGYIKKHEPMTQVDTTGKRVSTLASKAVVAVGGPAGHAKAKRGTINTVGRLCSWIRETIGDPEMLFEEENRYAGIKALIDVSDFEYDDADDEDIFWTYGNLIRAAIEAVRLAKEPTLVIDFADMVFLPIALDLVRPHYDLMVIDESQDMSQMQLQLAIKACRNRIVLVGDDKQAIYSFRGADVDCLDRLKAELEAQELNLTTTFRCAQAVVKAANKLVPDLKARPGASMGQVEASVTHDKMYAQVGAGDFVLSRTNAALVEVYMALIQAKKKAYIKGLDFGKRALAMIEKRNCNQLPALRQSLENWLAFKKKTIVTNIDDPDQAAVKKMKLEDDVALLLHFIDNAKDYPSLLKTIAESCADSPPRDAIILSTVHKAKGLEATNVWILGKTFMFSGAEEDNICYVAITRAKEKLYIVGTTMKEFLNLPELGEHSAIPEY